MASVAPEALPEGSRWQARSAQPPDRGIREFPVPEGPQKRSRRPSGARGLPRPFPDEGVEGRRVSRTMVNREFVDDAYLYRLIPVAPAA
jgi:hypothetical protein